MRKKVLLASSLILVLLCNVACADKSKLNNFDDLVMLRAKYSLIDFCFSNRNICKLDIGKFVKTGDMTEFKSTVVKKNINGNSLYLVQIQSEIEGLKGRTWGVVLYYFDDELFQLFVGEGKNPDSQKQSFLNGELVDESFDLDVFCPHKKGDGK